MSRRRAGLLLAAALLAALTAFAWWLSGRWLARPGPPSPPPAGDHGPR